MLAGIENHRVKIWVIFVGIWLQGKFLAAFAPDPLSQEVYGYF